MTSVKTEIYPKDITERRIRAFEQHYGRQATHLAAHAAFPLTLTTDVVYCLRETFLPRCPWYAAADVLLSGLCTTAGYDLFEMAAPTRRYLLCYLRDQFGEARVYDLERFMVAYLRHRLQEDGSDRSSILGDRPNWTTLACLRPGEAFDEIRQMLQQLALGEIEPKERFQLAALVESYGDFLADQGFQPLLIDMADRVAEGEPVDETAILAAVLVKSGFRVQPIEFDVATVVFDSERSESVPSELQPFEIETVTVDERGVDIARAKHRGSYFEEPLADGVTPLKLVAIPSGEFEMGSPEDEQGRWDDEGPQHRVKIAPFFISQVPITQAQWRAVASLPQQEIDLESDPSNFKGDDRPVERVSWLQAVEFCRRLSEWTGRVYRLPTEAEWEYACRADTTTPFYFGATVTTDLANYNGSVYLQEPEGHYRQETTTVGQFPANAFGLYDMHGNVWEWCLDDRDNNYQGDPPVDGSAWLKQESSSIKVVRGGSWYNGPRSCRSACRYGSIPEGRYNNFGFRVVSEARGL